MFVLFVCFILFCSLNNFVHILLFSLLLLLFLVLNIFILLLYQYSIYSMLFQSTIFSCFTSYSLLSISTIALFHTHPIAPPCNFPISLIFPTHIPPNPRPPISPIFPPLFPQTIPHPATEPRISRSPNIINFTIQIVCISIIRKIGKFGKG